MNPFSYSRARDYQSASAPAPARERPSRLRRREPTSSNSPLLRSCLHHVVKQHREFFLGLALVIGAWSATGRAPAFGPDPVEALTYDGALVFFCLFGLWLVWYTPKPKPAPCPMLILKGNDLHAVHQVGRNQRPSPKTVCIGRLKGCLAQIEHKMTFALCRLLACC
jgi:hypothetical protein